MAEVSRRDRLITRVDNQIIASSTSSEWCRPVLLIIIERLAGRLAIFARTSPLIQRRILDVDGKMKSPPDLR